jgi:FAD synthase
MSKNESPKSKMNLFSCVALIMSACIGSAIFSISGLTIYTAGPAAILSWILAAAIFGLYGFLVTRLAGIYPRSGGIYVFPRRAFGGKPGLILGFISGWGYLVSNIIAISFSAIYAAGYLVAGFPIFKGSEIAISLLLVLLAFGILLFSLKRSQKIQNVLVLLLVVAIVLYCSFAFFGGGFDVSRFNGFFVSGSGEEGGLLSAVPLALVAYGGCVVIAFLASDVSKPEKNIPRSLAIGLGLVALLYSLLIAGVIGNLPDGAMDDESIRYIPMFAAVSCGGLSSWPWMTQVISICAFLALFTTVIALLRVNARAVQAISTEGLMPGIFAKESKRGAPVWALVVLTVISLALCFAPQWTEHMIRLGAVLNIVSMTVTAISLLASHRGSLLLPIITIVILWICYVPEIFNGDATMWVFTVVVYAIGALLYFLCSRLRRMRLTGVVIHGKGRGRPHGMPTANLKVYDAVVMPKRGVWATKVYLNGEEYDGVTNVGLRPTDDDSPIPTVETVIIGLNRDIYGEEMTLKFLRYIRPTIKFNSLDELKVQIEKDISASRTFRS